MTIQVATGTRLGPYEIVSRLGAGGMGEVWRARDTRLDRSVAIKVLPAAFSADDNLKSRFEREAKAISQLNHPNICSLFDVGHEKGIDYLVMELIEGQTMADRLLRGPLPIADVVRYGSQIAEALERAHRIGIVHRDLKPQNVMITNSGAKLLDFGLAKSATISLGADEPTFKQITREGTIVGTFHYMSPEQLEGLAVDCRSDLFALGALLYEMLTASRAFNGTTQAAVIAAIMHSEPPPPSTVSSSVPSSLDRLIRKCLEKTPDDRWQNAGDLATELRWIAEVPELATPSRQRRASVIAAVAAMVLLAIGFTIGRWMAKDHPLKKTPASFAVALPAGMEASQGLSPTIALSPDATHLAYVVVNAERTQLYLRAIDQLDGAPIPGTDGADGPFFSPDGQWVGFLADHKLKKIAIAGGTAVTICDAGAPLGASWGPDDTIVFASVPNAGLSIVPASGGLPKVLMPPDFAGGETDYFWPQLMPDGKFVFFTALGNSGRSRVEIRNMQTGEQRTLIEEGMNARYSAGSLVFSRAGALFAAPFDDKKMQVAGAAVPVLDGVSLTNIGAAQFSLSREGTLVYLRGGSPNIDRALVSVNRAGTARTLPGPLRAYQDPRISPDGRRLVVEIYAGTKGDLWVYDLDRGTLSRLTFEGFENETPVWMPDNERVAFSSSRAGVRRALFSKRIGESGGDEPLLSGDHHMHLTSASGDGQFLAITDYDPVTQGDIWVLPLDGTRKAKPFLQTSFHEWGAVFSPDNHWLLYVSNESGRDEIFVQAFPGRGQKIQVSNEGGREPAWARNGRELFYRSGRKMMAVSVASKPALSIGKPHELFEAAYENGLPLGHTNYDVASDGESFIMIQTLQQGSAAQRVNVRLDWVRQLQNEHRLPTGK